MYFTCIAKKMHVEVVFWGALSFCSLGPLNTLLDLACLDCGSHSKIHGQHGCFQIAFSDFILIWLVVSTPLKNISQNGNLPQIGMNITNIWNHHLVKFRGVVPSYMKPHPRQDEKKLHPGCQLDSCEQISTVRVDWNGNVTIFKRKLPSRNST